jgi:hypothetical protein
MRVTCFLVALALFASNAVATPVADDASLTDLISSLEDNLDVVSLDELEMEDDAAASRAGSGSGSGSGSGAGGLTDNFAPEIQQAMFGAAKYDLPEYAGYADVHVKITKAATSDSVFAVTCIEENMSNPNAPWNYVPRIATCPNQITVLRGQTTATLQIWVMDNDVTDGDAKITISLTYLSGEVPVTTPAPVTVVHVMDDDVNKPEEVVVNPTRCDPRMPMEIAIRYFGDRLANQFYKQSGARGQYFCTFVGVTRDNWAFGVRSINSFKATGTLGAANRWQLWWNAANSASGGEIRYESISRSIVDGLQGPFVAVNGFKPAGQVTVTKVSDAVTYACLSVSGASDAIINQQYRWELTNTEFVRFRGVFTKTIVLVAAPANKYDFNSGYWYFVSADSYVPYYTSEHRGGPPTGTYLVAARATGASVPVVVIDNTCPAVVAATQSCKRVAATGSTWFKVNQVYREKLGVTTARLSIYVGETYNAWSLSHYTLGAENWSDFWFISYQARQIYYANKRGLGVVAGYYAVTQDYNYQGTVYVKSIGCAI